MIFFSTDDKVEVHGEGRPDSPVLFELSAGDEFKTLGSPLDYRKQWLNIRLTNGKEGFIPRSTKTGRVRLAWLTAKETIVRESPSNNSTIKATLKQKSEVHLLNTVTDDSGNTWIQIRSKSGVTGFVPGHVPVYLTRGRKRICQGLITMACGFFIMYPVGFLFSAKPNDSVLTMVLGSMINFVGFVVILGGIYLSWRDLF